MPNKATPKTLGQRIDDVLQPLYEEADEHRATLELIRSQIVSLQEQADAATAGLEQVESRMAEVVRTLATQEPVLAAVVGGKGAAPTQAAPESVAGPTPDAAPAAPAAPAQPTAEAEPETEPEPAAEPVAQTPAEPVSEVASEPDTEPQPEPEPVAETAAAPNTPEVPGKPAPDEPVPLDLDPEVDQAMVDEAASLLAAEPAGPTDDSVAEPAVQASADQPEPQEEEPASASQPPADIAAAAQRAAEAAKQLREKSGTAR